MYTSKKKICLLILTIYSFFTCFLMVSLPAYRTSSAMPSATPNSPTSGTSPISTRAGRKSSELPLSTSPSLQSASSYILRREWVGRVTSNPSGPQRPDCMKSKITQCDLFDTASILVGRKEDGWYISW